jgi:hypothetical protein
MFDVSFSVDVYDPKCENCKIKKPELNKETRIFPNCGIIFLNKIRNLSFIKKFIFLGMK